MSKYVRVAKRQAGFRAKLKLYGLTKEQYNQLFIAQFDLCAICQIHKDTFKRGLSIDHDHDTNLVRGLLCQNCNMLLGCANDNIDILYKAIEYLERTN